MSSTTCPNCEFNDDKTILIAAPIGAKNVIIPNTVQTIFGIDNNHNAFVNAKETLESFEFEKNNCLKIIQESAFYGCSKLQKINLSSCDSLISIGNHAFDSCKSVNEVIFPINSKLRSIGEYAFSYNAFKEIIFPRSIEELGKYCIANNDKLVNATFEPDSVIKLLPSYFLNGCTKILSFTIPKSVTTLNHFALGASNIIDFIVEEGNPSFVSSDHAVFTKKLTTLKYYPEGITGSYEIPNGVETIGTAAFDYTKLTSVILPNSVVTINSWVFYSSSITEIKLSEKLRTIDEYCFGQCDQLLSITIPEGVYKIGASCFESCTSLKEIVLPSTLTSLGGGAFNGVDPSIITFNEKSDFAINENMMITNKNHTTLCMYCGSTDSVQIPNTITKILDKAFSKVTTIKHITFQEDSELVSIGPSAFSRCSNLEDIVLPNKLETIGIHAFELCSNLVEIVISSSLKTIKYNCFRYCSLLTKISIKSSIAYTLEYSIFESVKSLQTVELSEGLISIGDSCFKGCQALEEIKIPASLQSLGEYVFSESGLSDIIFVEESSLEVLPDFTFYNCISLKQIKLPNSVKALGNYSFSGTGLENLILPQSVQVIDSFCFDSCSSLKTFTIPKDSKLSDISYGVFTGCDNFETIICNSTNFTLENTALFDKDMTQFIVLPPKSPVKYFSFPKTLKTIKSHALYGCRNIEVIFMPSDSVTEINQNAFMNCINLRQINIPLCVKTIGSNAFRGCKNLQCGLNIENRNSSYIDNLIGNARFPRKALTACIDRCTFLKKLHAHFIPLISIIIFQ